MLKGENGREVVSRVVDRLEEIRADLPPGVRVRAFYNQGEVVARTSRTVFTNLLEGGAARNRDSVSLPQKYSRVAGHGVCHSTISPHRLHCNAALRSNRKSDEPWRIWTSA